MNPLYAVLLDGGFVTKKLSEQVGRFPFAADVMDLCVRISGHAALQGHDLLRIKWTGRASVASACAGLRTLAPGASLLS
ncbi:MAG: hypothetical protein ACT4P2_16640 [Pseudomonadota bacterium]